MRASGTWGQFIVLLNTACPQIDHTYELPFLPTWVIHHEEIRRKHSQMSGNEEKTAKMVTPEQLAKSLLRRARPYEKPKSAKK